MTATLYLNVNTYPLPYGSTAQMFCDVYLASHFYNDPTGNTLPPDATPVASATVTVAFGGTAASLAGLDNTKSYWLRVYGPQGYAHWFPVNWTKGNSAGDPMVVSVSSIEGLSTAPAPPVPAPQYNIEVGINANIVNDGIHSVTSLDSTGMFPVNNNSNGTHAEAVGNAGLMPASYAQVTAGGSIGALFRPSLFQGFAQDPPPSVLPPGASYTYTIIYAVSEVVSGDFMVAVATGSFSSVGFTAVWPASVAASQGATFSYAGAGGSDHPISGPSASPRIYAAMVQWDLKYVL